MVKSIMNKVLIGALALIMGVTILTVPLITYANVPRPASYWQKGIVNGDGVRHRRTPGNENKPANDVLGLMYKNEEIWLDPDYWIPGFSAWCATWRTQTRQLGWMEWSFFVHSK